MRIQKASSAFLAGTVALMSFTPGVLRASDLSYTFLDFQALDNTLGTTGVQTPVPGQTVSIFADSGDGVAVAGSLALPGRFYISGAFRTSLVDITGVIQSPLASVTVTDTFDLVSSDLGIGYQRELADNFDFIAELSHDSVDYDFGSLAGENFDTVDTGTGARLGFRWNPKARFELFASARYSEVGRVNLAARELENDTWGNIGIRWYFYEGLATGVDYESGDVETFTFSLRFSFGRLPW
jgi:hypothetical protein